jgi:transcriptional adapter 2-alpha
MGEPNSNRKRKRNQSPIQEDSPSNTSSPSMSSPELQNKPYKVQVDQSTPSVPEQKASSGAKYHCNHCKKDITNKVRIKCAQCQDFDLCVDCFFVGVETQFHKNDHKYRIMDDLSAPLYTSKWSADEELLLLEGIEQFGLGNWADIAEHVGTKNRYECEFHYWTTYIDVPTFPIPPPRQAIVEDVHVRPEDVKKDDDGMLLYYDRNKPKQPEKKRKINNKLINLGIELSYMPLRGDFIEKEFENEAEDLIAEMEITENDSEIERQRKLNILSLYDFILSEREKRKRFALERGIIADWARISKEDKKKTKYELELCEKYRRFARFTTPEKFTALMDSLYEEKRISKRIEQLQNYRKSGIMSLEQGEDRKNSVIGSAKKITPFGSTTSAAMLSNSLAGTNYHYVSNPKNVVNRYRTDYEGAFDIRLYPGAELLSQRERDLCTELRIAPRVFLAAKDALIREGFRLNHMGLILTKKMACDFLSNSVVTGTLTDGEMNDGSLPNKSLERSQTGTIYDFCVLSGWITV